MRFLGFIIFFYLSASFCCCGQVNKSRGAATNINVAESEYRLNFPEYGFSINAPCVMKDVSAHSSGNFLLNYGGVTDENNPEKMAAYQLIVIRVPVGYRDLSKEEYERMVDKALRSQAQKFKTFKPVRFGYEEYPGYVCETSHNGYGQKGVYFAKENYIIALTVISNNNLNAKFNKFTNGFRSLPNK